ncbi:Interferon-induced very large GTPase 1 [Holothuria leucospilota]|uniref:Interferon-induced very large GTPase 1 n=1 Tax=Holothuria leucospilota TaxID=206669 RepID=A0A9Q1CRX6_HOLLE|nr:Interferon-induced very large GTPase 1 [Holothuria leucospilota]
MLTLNTVRKLATVLNFQSGEIDQIERDPSASYVFINLLKERGIISQKDISNLIESLEDINLHGVAENVAESYNKNVKKVTLPPQDITSDMEDNDAQQGGPSPLGVETELPADPQVISTEETDVENESTLQSESDEKPSGNERVEQTVPDLGLTDGAFCVTDSSMETERGRSLNESVSNDLADFDFPKKMSEQFKEFLLRLGLEKGLYGEYSIRDSQEVKYGLLDVVEECSIFEQFISRITSYDYRVHLVRSPLSTRDRENIESNLVCTKESDDEDWFNYLKAEESCSDTINSSSARDTLFGILTCLDPFLLQEILMKLSACQLAVPLLMPDCGGNVTLNLWGLRKVSKSWYDSCDNVIKTETVVSHPFPAVSALRIGEISISKSNILNKLLGPAQSNDEHAYFLSHEQDPQLASWSKGTLECAWFLPNQDIDPSKLSTAFSLLNLRGNSSHFRLQRQFATRNSFATIVFCDSNNINGTNRAIIDEIKAQSHVILVIPQEKKTRRKPQYKSSMTIIHTNGYNALEVSKLILNALSQLFKEKECIKRFCIENSASLCENLNITVDEANKTYKEAKRDAKDIYDLICQQFPNINKSNIFVLQKLWKQWSELDKNKRWIFKTVDIEHEIEKIKSKKKSLRELQCEEIPTKIMLKFIKYCSVPTESRLFFIRYLEYFLNAMSNATFKPLLKDLHFHSTERRKISSRIKEKTTLKEGWETDISQNRFANYIEKLKSTEQEITNKKRDCIKKIDENSFGIEYFVREIAQITECHFYTEKDMKQYHLDIKKLPSFAADLLLNGYPIEIMDGDANHVPLRWIQEVLKTLSNLCGEDAKVYVISVLGIQSSGKSTLLNSMFGVQFAVRAGRCTKGAFMQLVPVHETLANETGCNFFVIIDTEGLGAPEKLQNMSPEYDNELATFALCNSDLTLINIGGQTMGEEMSNVLEIAAHAFIRMKEVNLKVECRVVQQFVADVTAEERNEAAMENIMMKLDNAIEIAAKKEGKDHLYRQFSDVFVVQNLENDSNNVQYIPSLWRGFMSIPDHHYSTKVLQLKQNIIRSMEMKENKLSVMDLSQRMTDVWNAIKKENFVFSFQNTKEITLYEELMKTYRAWISPVRVRVMQRELQARQNIENSKTDRIHDIYEDSIKSIEQLLENECETVEENLSLYLNNQKYKEIKRYAMSFYSDLSTFKIQMLANATMEISQFIALSVKIHEKVPEGELLSASLHEEVALLAAEIRKQINEQVKENRTNQNSHDTFITQKFEEFWAKWMQDKDEKYPLKTLSQITQEIECKVKQCIIQETQNKTLGTTVLHYLQSENFNQYAISSSYITKPSHIQRAKILFNTVDEKSSNVFSELITKIKTYAENNENFTGNVVELLQEVKEFINLCDIMPDKTIAICYFFSVFIRLLQNKQVEKEFSCIIQNADLLSAISKDEKVFLEGEIEETLKKFMSNNHYMYLDRQKQIKRHKKGQNNSEYAETSYDDLEVQTDKSKPYLHSVFSNIGKKFGNWRSNPSALSLKEFIDNVIAMTETKYKQNVITAEALNYFCKLTVTHCCRNFPSEDLQEAIAFSCERGIQYFRKCSEEFLKRYIDSNEYVMEYAAPIEYSNIQSKIKFVLNIIDDYRVNDSEVIKSVLTEEVVSKYGCSAFSFPLFLHLDRQYIHILPLRREEILRSIHEKVTSIKRAFLVEGGFKAPFNAIAVSKVLSDTIHMGNSDIFPNEMLGPTLVHIGAWLIPFCAVAQHEFERSKNPAVMLREEKDLFLSQFESLCSEKYDEIIAKTFFDFIIKTAKGSLKYKLYPELVREFLVGNDIFKMKRCFIGTVLVDICERDSYQDAVDFLNDFEEYSKRWILQYVVRNCNQMGDSLLKTTVDKCIANIKHATLYCVVKADEVLDHTTPDLSKWLDTFSDTLYQKIAITCEETEIAKVKKYLKVSNMKTFSTECSKLLQGLDEILKKTTELPTPGNMKQTQQWLLNALPKQIHLEIFESFKGCTEQCPFCGAVCEETLSGHPKHVVNLHFPKGIHGMHWLGTKKLAAEMCTSSIESDILYRTPPWVENPEFRPFKNYTVDYGNWYIQGIQDDKPIDYWKYIFATFNELFAERYSVLRADIPVEWTHITKQAALQCAKTAYQLK